MSVLDLEIGTIFASDFRIVRPLAKGGMGAVYVAEQLSTGRERALKLMHHTLLTDADMRRRFEQEAKIGALIKSDHVVQVIAAGIDAPTNVPWLAMELLEGEDLARYAQRKGPLAVPEVLEILGQVCHALGAAHEVNVVHRDLKPENIFLARARREGAPVLVKVLDFGIAKVVAEAHSRDTAAIGTPLWMAPEQAGGRVGPQTDVWALGLIAFWMLTGRSYWLCAKDPATQASPIAALREIAIDTLEMASERCSRLGCAVTLPAGFDVWFSRAVARDVENRFSNATEAYSQLASTILGSGDTVQISLAPRMEPSVRANHDVVALAPTVGLTPPGLNAEVPRRAGKARLLLAAGASGLVGLLALAWFRGLPSHEQRMPSSGASTVPVASVPPTPHAVPSEASTGAPRALDPKDPAIVWKVPVGSSPQRGPEDAPVTIVEFANYQCPFSKGAEPGLRRLLADYAGRVRLIWKDDPLAVHSRAEASAAVAREALAQRGVDGFWAAHDLFLEPEFKPSEKALFDAAKTLGLDLERLKTALATHVHTAAISADADLADDFGVVGTPYFFVNGRRAPTTPNLDGLRALIDEELKRTQALGDKAGPAHGRYDRLIASGEGALPFERKSFHLGTALSPTWGATNPKAILVEFCDFTNLLCRLVDSTVEQLIAEFPKAVSFVWVDVPTTEDSQRASVAGMAAYRQAGAEGFTQMRKRLLEAQKQPNGFSARNLQQLARSAGIPAVEFQQWASDPELVGQMQRDAASAHQAGVADELPGFLVCGPAYCDDGGYFLSGGQPRRAFEKRIRMVLAAQAATAGQPH